MRKSRISLFLLILLAGSFVLPAESPDVKIQRIDLTGLSEIRVYFTIVDENGDFIKSPGIRRFPKLETAAFPTQGDLERNGG